MSWEQHAANDPRLEHFRNPEARKEFLALSREEREAVERTSDLIAKEADFFRLCMGKKIATNYEISDFGTKTFHGPETTIPILRTWAESIPLSIKQYLGGIVDTAVLFRFPYPDPTKPYSLFYFHGKASGQMKNPKTGKLELVNPNDVRPNPEEFAFAMHDERTFSKTIADDETALRTLPISILHAGMKISPKDRVYFDGSMTGARGTWKDPRRPADEKRGLVYVDLKHGRLRNTRDMEVPGLSDYQCAPEQLLQSFETSSFRKGRDTAFLQSWTWSE
ncbi:MAG: hypothetical protein AAB473_04475 [Patescibacteria group bacterium]